jgi:hypothetical protein
MRSVPCRPPGRPNRRWQSITAGNGTLANTATSGHLDGSGNYVFAVSTVKLTNGGVLTINGTGLTVGQDVVSNIAANNPNFNGAISLIGLTDDQVLFNIIGSNSTLTISSNGQTLSGDFLDYSGNIQMNHSLLDGCLFGGSSQNMQAVSGATIVAPAATAVPEPSSLAVLGFVSSLSASCGTAFVRLRAFGPRDLRPLTGAALWSGARLIALSIGAIDLGPVALKVAEVGRPVRPQAPPRAYL